ncbi:hypothetical protein NP233_g3862 [Leucocoprinus birnbaumii]|uniref:Uncharacterized protein n=1 Tax=Leucocoprinus birnbaumii TaxID=56174 RepID=A0AAD5YXN7_9AGAR|nr:hypothetical protein NP233_g3862 [Leucocoprinus birnbaumii]
MDSENLFFSLPQRKQRKIDSAFNLICKKLEATTSSTSVSAGGFIPESGGFVRDDEEDQLGGGGFIHEEETGGGFIQEEPNASGGGFINDDEDQHEVNAHSQIPLSSIPSALQYLDLPPDDEEVISVFRNAATGWTSSSTDATSLRRTEGEDQYVSRDDWRSVCAVLLEHDVEGDDGVGDEDVEMAEPGNESDVADSDEYQESEVEVQEEDGDDGEYVKGPASTAARRRTRRTAHKSTSPPLSLSSDSSDSGPHKLTSRQRQTCVTAYSLFFPDVPLEELVDQRIMIKDIQRVAKLLNEKLKTEEVSRFCAI